MMMEGSFMEVRPVATYQVNIVGEEFRIIFDTAQIGHGRMCLKNSP